MLTAGSVDAWLACALRRRQIAGRFSLLFGTRGPMLDSEQMFRRYQDLQAYVRWSDDDVARVRGMAHLLQPHLPALVDDFYEEVARHPEAHKVFTGGEVQIARLKRALLAWLRELLTGPYDRDYVARRWKVGARHVEIGLDQVYTNAALSRLRDGLVRLLGETWTGACGELVDAIRSLNKLLDLDLAKIEDAYQSEYAARLQGAERLATLGQIAGGVAHELRNPLNVVRTSLYYLNNSPNASAEKRAEHMHRIERNVTRAEGVITTLTNFARFPTPDAKPFSAERCARDALEHCVLSDTIETRLDFPADLPPALADPNQIAIVLDNLIRNAIDAMPSGGRLTLSGRNVESGLEIGVADTGVGIAPENLRRLTEPLFSTKARGMGLGLALSRMILDKNHGSLHASSEPGQGTTITIRLPAVVNEGDRHR